MALVFPGMAGRAVGCVAMLVKQDAAEKPFLGPYGWQANEYRWLSGWVRNDGQDLIVPLERGITPLLGRSAPLRVVLLDAGIEGVMARTELAVASRYELQSAPPPPPSLGAERALAAPALPWLRPIAPAVALMVLVAVGAGVAAYVSSPPAPLPAASIAAPERAAAAQHSRTPVIAALSLEPAEPPSAATEPAPPATSGQALEPQLPAPARAEPAPPPPPAAPSLPQTQALAPPLPAPPAPSPSLSRAPAASPGSAAFRRGVEALRHADPAAVDRAFDEAGRYACDYFDLAAKLLDPTVSNIKRQFTPDGLKALQYYMKARADPSCRDEAERRIRDLLEWAQGHDGRAVLRWWSEHR